MKRSNRQVTVILNADVTGVGFAGELVTVRAGFARNFLLRGGQAEVATPEKRKARETEIAKAEARRTDEVTKLEELAAKISAEPLHLSLKVGPNHQVFGSITAKDVAAQVKARFSEEVPPQQLPGLPLKALGRHP